MNIKNADRQRRNVRRFTAAFTAFVVMLLVNFIAGHKMTSVFAEPDNSLVVTSMPVSYTPEGGYVDVPFQVKNNTTYDVTGISIIDSTIVTDSEGDKWTPYEFQYSNRTGTDACSKPVNATADELGYTIKAGQTATFYMRVFSGKWRKTGSYNDYIQLGRKRKELTYDYDPETNMTSVYYKTIIEAEYTGQVGVTNVVYNPVSAALIIGTSNNHGSTISAFPDVIDFGTVNLSNAGDDLLKQSKHFFVKNISPLENDEHGNPHNITVDMQLSDNYDFDDFCFSFDDELLNGMSWAPLTPATETNFSTASGTVMINAEEMIAGTYTTNLEIRTVPFGVKINGNSANTDGTHLIPVKVTLTGRNNRLPARPTKFNASPGNNQVQLTWEAPKEGLTYRVYRREGREEKTNPDTYVDVPSIAVSIAITFL